MKSFNQLITKINVPRLERVDLTAGRYYQNMDDLTVNPYPSVTTVLAHQEKEALVAWRQRVGDVEANKIGRVSSFRGTVVHEKMEHYIQNKVCDKKIMPDAASMVKQMRAVADAYIDNVRAVEIQLCSEMMGVAGTIDLVADYEGEIAIIDWKTSLRPKNPDWITDYFLQKAAYAVMWRECTGIKVDKLVTLVSVLEGQPQVFLNDKNTWIHDFQDRLKAFNLAHPSASYAVPVTH